MLARLARRTPQGPNSVRRCVLIILIVAALAAWISRAERVACATSLKNDWVRTAEGWERRAGLNADRSRPPLGIHPGLIAAFQLGASLFALLAFPGRATPAPASRRPAPHLSRPQQWRGANLASR